MFFPSVCVTPLERFSFAFLLLMVYSFLGWCGEMVYCSLGQRRLCEKRGFLNGLLCPIYGHGALVVLLVLDGGCANPLFTFLLGAILTSLVEYITSYAMEKLFHMRWWDYSQYRFHINGRVCLLNSTLFGLASVFLCHAASPPVSARLASLFVSGIGVPLALVLLAVYLVDLALSVRSAIQIGDRLAKLHAIQDELTGRLEALKAEQQQAMELQRKRLEGSLTAACLGVEERAAQAAQAVQSKLEPLAGLSAGFAARLEAARGEAQQKLHALYDRQDFFERRLLRAFPSMRAPHYGDALKKLLEYRSIRKK
ncbi:MAG: putative ABC transporter permease [Oscillospiraceae bacterium]|jgi:uncharacterized membrane protein|nr:putative ABC transporter permease [Oscillospiraceae bacterium]